MKLRKIWDSDVRRTRLGLLAAVCMTVCGVCEAEAPQKVDGGIWGDPEISAAVDKIRKGDNVNAIFLTSKVDPKSSWKPLMKNLSAYHACLGTNENPRIQFFAIAAISKLKDKSSVEPLQKFIVTSNHRLQEGTISDKEEAKEPAKAAQRRLQGGLLSREESVMLQLAIRVAMETLGEIDGDTDFSVAFLGSLLKHDMPKEFGGAVAHSALAKKGAPGLRRLLEESLTADEQQRKYVGSAISEIRDPALFGALATACLDSRYAQSVGGSLLSAIASMRDKVPQAEQFIIDILMKDEKSYMRFGAAYTVATFGTEKGFTLLRKVRTEPGKSGEEFVQYIDNLLLQYDADSMLEGVVKNILSPSTPDAEKIQLSANLLGINKTQIAKHATTLVPCLTAENAAGEPLNEVRTAVWCVLYKSTKVEHPLTLDFDENRRFELVTEPIREAIKRSLASTRLGVKEKNEFADAIIKKNVTKWVKSNAEKAGGGK